MPPVGGRLEPAPVRPVTNSGDRWRLVALLVLAAGVHAVVVARTAMTARDGVGFARTALQLAEPSALKSKALPDPTVFDVLRQPGHPPGYPAAVLAVATASDAVQPGQVVQERVLFAAQLVSAAAGTLLVFPLYWLGRTLFGQTAGFLGAVLFQCLPVAARYTSDAVTEGLYLLLLATALLLGTRAVRKPGVGGFLLCGLVAGLSYLVRPEGALAVVAVGLVVVFQAVRRAIPVGAALAWLTALAVGALVPTTPYMLLIGGFTNKPSMQGIFPTLNTREAIQKAGGAAGPAVFASWQAGDLPGTLRELFKEGTKAFHYAPPAFALVGLGLAARRWRDDAYLLVPLAFAGLMLPVLLALGLKEGYISERHTLPPILVLCPFAAAGLTAVAAWAGKPWLGWALLVGIAGTCVPGLLKPLHKDRLGHKLAGEHLREYAAPEDVLLDPYDWAGFYAGRTLRNIPPDPDPTPGRYRWAVLEPSEKNQSKLPRLEAAANVANDGANPPVEIRVDPAGKVVVYRQLVKPDAAKKP